ncbi:hypothetical protein [Rhodopirellula sp. MGV]|uniref:hypothetical protein n=1 Tax=Rhodopirellula sp. MGV TaxID=2023130 RepID=UPI000B9650A7|nr:hypothetical protein [Rhodopirellula sp. MGV]OYP35523.1 hypothetical protein CGZ80_11835 [Rhodopirellula sp. MGV]PNY34486.1 hypothetical protein C2E31_23180 [Rhodopirellula baltica]
MDSPIVIVDDKHVPLYRIVWVSDLPHYCGDEECQCEGEYEVRLDIDDSLWTSQKGRDDVIAALKKWCSDPVDGTDNSL